MKRALSPGRGTFLSLDGPEGAGKSTQSRMLAAALRRAGIPVVALREPGSTRVGQALRRVLLRSEEALGPRAETLLFWAARVQLLQEKILPALKQGSVVICDRYHDATVAYQGYGGELDPAWVDRLGREVIQNVLPHRTLLFDIPTEKGMARLKRGLDRMEKKARSYHQRVRKGYLEMARREPGRFRVLDAALDRGQLHAAVLREVASALVNPSHRRALRALLQKKGIA